MRTHFFSQEKSVFPTPEIDSAGSSFNSTTPRILQLEEKSTPIEKLLAHVILGEEDKVAFLLCRHPELLLETGTIHDYHARHTFYGVTAFNLALWSKDRHMWALMIDCIPNNKQGYVIKTKLLLQYEAFELLGILYTFGNTPIFNSHGYNFERLFDAMQSYIDHLEAYKTCRARVTELSTQELDDSYKILQEKWLAIGLIQRTLPIPVINEYCHPTRSFSLTDSLFKEKILPRFGYFEITERTSYADDLITRTSSHDASGLGIDYALERHSLWTAEASKPGKDGLLVGNHCASDLAALMLWDKIRTKERTQIPKKLKESLNSTHESINRNRCIIS